MARLYIVATPIGNLGDITLRAIETLRNCRVVYCEDTRHSRKLFSHLGLSVTTRSCHGHNAAVCIPHMLELLAEGADIAYVSDAGSPGISDPGSKIARDVRSAGFEVVPIPGPSAVTALLSVSGLAGRGWFFEGFLPPKGRKRLTRIEELVAREEPFALYESPHRIGKLFSELTAAAADWSVVVGREVTKMHEQITVGRVDEIAELVGTSDIPARGEFVVLVWRRKSR